MGLGPMGYSREHPSVPRQPLGSPEVSPPLPIQRGQGGAQFGAAAGLLQRRPVLDTRDELGQQRRRPRLYGGLMDGLGMTRGDSGIGFRNLTFEILVL